MMLDDPRRVTAPSGELLVAGRVFADAGPARRIVGARLFWRKAPGDPGPGVAAQALVRTCGPARLESAGVTLSAGTSATASYVDFRGPRDAVRRALRDFAEALPNAVISVDAFESARAAATHQAQRRAHEPMSVAVDHFRRVRAGMPPEDGDPSGLTHDQLPALGPRLARLVVAGDPELESYVDSLAALSGTVEHDATVELALDPPAHTEVKGPAGGQAYVLWGGMAPMADAGDHVALELSAHLLGGWSGSRWHTLFREQLGYTYGTTAVASSLRFGPLTAGLAHVGMSVAADALAKTESLVLEQAKSFLDHGPGAAELSQAAVQLLRTEAHYHDSTRNLMTRTASFLQAGLGPRFARERIEQLRTVEPETFLGRVRELLRDRTLVTVAP